MWAASRNTFWKFVDEWKKYREVTHLMLEAAHRVPERSKRQKWSFQTILEHFKKKKSKIRQNFLVKLDSHSFQHDIWRSTINYLVNPYYEGWKFTCSEGDFLEIPKM